MKFFTCVSGKYVPLAPIYEYCVKRVYPDALVEVREIEGAQLQRFLIDPKDEYVHVTDVDILLLPHTLTHQEYFGKHVQQGACYLRGATQGSGREWTHNDARICGGHLGFYPEYYQKTKELRESITPLGGREMDEVALCRMMREAGYKIPQEPYTFPDGTEWNKEYRDLHLGDFLSHKYKKWSPNREKISELFAEDEFRRLRENLPQYWKFVFSLVDSYVETGEVIA